MPARPWSRIPATSWCARRSPPGVEVFAVPGPSAALAALIVSGLPTDRFFVAGFLPTRRSPRRRAIAELAPVPATLIVFEAARRLPATLADLAAELGPRPAAVARELTKRFEEVRRGTLAELAAHYARGRRAARRDRDRGRPAGPRARAACRRRARRAPGRGARAPAAGRRGRRRGRRHRASRAASSIGARSRCRAGEPRSRARPGAAGRKAWPRGACACAAIASSPGAFARRSARSI